MAAVAAWRAQKRLSRRFWLCSLAALGYAEGGRVSRSLGGWQTICWGLVLALPLLIWQLQGQAASLRQASAGAVLAVV